MPSLSCLIPLYRSKRFLPFIEENIREHLTLGAEILIGDRHGWDDTTEILHRKYGREPRVRVIAVTDGGHWVQNINTLIAEASGEFLRIIPHDDTATGESTALLADALARETDAILATGVVRGQDLSGRPLPERDEPNLREIPGSTVWTNDDALGLYWTGRFAGAFKGLIRTAPIRSKRLTIRPTRTLVSSERAWLKALALQGRFAYVPDSVLIKRYHETSTQQGWQFSSRTVFDTARVLRAYADEVFKNPTDRESARRNILFNARKRARWVRYREGAPPAYLTLSQTDAQWRIVAKLSVASDVLSVGRK